MQEIREAMIQSLEGGQFHSREKIKQNSTLPYKDFLSIGLALKECFLNPERHDELIQRLTPHANVIIGVLPPGIQSHGLLPSEEELASDNFQYKKLSEFSDSEIRRWIIDDGSLVYGELDRQELENYFAAVFPLLVPGGHFVDLGSGLGKVVMSAALHFPFETCKGVEILSYRHRMAGERFLNMLKVGQDGFQLLNAPTQASESISLPWGDHLKAIHLLTASKRVEFQEGDMFTFDVSNANLIFIYSTCFGSFMHHIAHKLANEAPENCLVSSTTYAINHPAFQLIKHFPAGALAWTDMFIYQRVGTKQWPETSFELASEPSADEWEAKARALLNEHIRV